MRLFILLILLLATGAFSFQLYNLIQQKSALELEITQLSTKIEPLQKENRNLASDIDYFQNPDRLENELRKAGYAKSDEKMLIIVPAQ